MCIKYTSRGSNSSATGSKDDSPPSDPVKLAERGGNLRAEYTSYTRCTRAPYGKIYISVISIYRVYHTSVEWRQCEVLDEGDAKCWRMKATQKKNKNRSNTWWKQLTRTQCRSSGVASIWIIESYERINQHMAGVLLQIWNVLTSCSERNDP